VSLEIDMLRVSNGDAFVIRCVNPVTLAEWVAVIDGGETDADGEEVVKHVRNYTRKKEVDDLICTHPDADHIGGLSAVVRNVVVRRAWVHDPGQHVNFLNLTRRLLAQPRSRAAQKIYRSMEQCASFLALLDRRGVPRYEPFAGAWAGCLEILGPTRDYYRALLQHFDDLKGVFVEDDRAERYDEAVENRLAEANPDSVIDEDNETSAENNSSVICRLTYGEDTYLFTGDAGVTALQLAIDTYKVANIRWLDAPHHGSKHNICSSLLDILMPRLAYFSARGTRKHPSRAVINALKRRGCLC